MTGLRTAAEIAIGVLYAIGAVFNLVYTLRNSDQFYGSFADGAWLPPARRFINEIVLANGTVFTVLLILFQAVSAVLILSRGDYVAAALMIGTIFSVLAALASSPAGTVGNLILAAIQMTLALAR
jgi:hypothetical protein